MTFGKYDQDIQFNDPIVRCCDCKALVLRQTLRDSGGCPTCGNRRVRNVLTLTEAEMDKLKSGGIDPEFLAMFEGVEREVL